MEIVQTNCPVHDPPQWRCARCGFMIDDPAHTLGCANRGSAREEKTDDA